MFDDFPALRSARRGKPAPTYDEALNGFRIPGVLLHRDLSVDPVRNLVDCNVVPIQRVVHDNSCYTFERGACGTVGACKFEAQGVTPLLVGWTRSGFVPSGGFSFRHGGRISALGGFA